MTGDLTAIARGLDLCEEHIAAAACSRHDASAILSRMAAVSAPDGGAAKVLLVYARLATTACDWVEGDLGVDLTGDRDDTVIEAFTELGRGLRERLFPPMRFRAPLLEFERAIRRVPHMIAPLLTRSVTGSRIRLGVTEIVRRTTAPPPPITISTDSLFARDVPHDETIVILSISEPPAALEPSTSGSGEPPDELEPSTSGSGEPPDELEPSTSGSGEPPDELETLDEGWGS